jgi:predicted DNA-binding transcriptional regulator AlpA
VRTQKTLSKPAAVLPEAGFVRLQQIVAPNGVIPVGRSTWWAGIANGRFPSPIKLSPRVSAWRVEDIRALIEKLGASK